MFAHFVDSANLTAVSNFSKMVIVRAPVLSQTWQEMSFGEMKMRAKDKIAKTKEKYKRSLKFVKALISV